MNILHMKYAIEVAKCGSINKAAEKLLMNQPNLSRAIRDLEDYLGVKIFIRSTKGMVLTPEGETFLHYAKKILKQVDEVESIFKNEITHKKLFSISVPRASYISKAFAEFSLSLTNEKKVELFYKETNSNKAIKNILEADYKLGIIRYAKNFEMFFKAMLDEKGLEYELITEFHYVLVMNKENQLANKNIITLKDLENCIEIAHADNFVPVHSFEEVRKEEISENINRHIFVFERASQFELLSKNKETFMWVSPIQQSILDSYGLVQKICPENKRVYNDILIYKKDYKFTDLDKLFIKKLLETKSNLFK